MSPNEARPQAGLDSRDRGHGLRIECRGTRHVGSCQELSKFRDPPSPGASVASQSFLMGNRIRNWGQVGPESVFYDEAGNWWRGGCLVVVTHVKYGSIHGERQAGGAGLRPPRPRKMPLCETCWLETDGNKLCVLLFAGTKSRQRPGNPGAWPFLTGESVR